MDSLLWKFVPFEVSRTCYTIRVVEHPPPPFLVNNSDEIAKARLGKTSCPNHLKPREDSMRLNRWLSHENSHVHVTFHTRAILDSKARLDLS